ncbi:hypothetical protein [Streptomyces sp. NRRL F-5727]|uniref:hypothetical protein n=1 Tax=Streptomyces sp. NRRL F-5727 TaxID=1463871 RepID=UPI00131D3444|nr:hypothetical protein [Streptomyces sp. NRRL F-5727]
MPLHIRRGGADGDLPGPQPQVGRGEQPLQVGAPSGVGGERGGEAGAREAGAGQAAEEGAGVPGVPGGEAGGDLARPEAGGGGRGGRGPVPESATPAKRAGGAVSGSVSWKRTARS